MGALSFIGPQSGRTYKEWFEDMRCDEGDLAPRHLQSHLTAMGGTTIYGKPLFRLARTETVWRKLAIDFPIWRDTDDPNHLIPIKEAVDMMNAGVSAKEVHEFVTWTAERNERPLRRDTGYRWVNKYPVKGIVIEKWNPPDKYGNPAEWEAKKIMGYSFCGPYPHEGDYEMIGGEEEEEEDCEIINLFDKPFTLPRLTRLPWPTKDKLSIWIRKYHEVLHTQPENPYTRTMLRIAEFQQREVLRYQRIQKSFEPLVKDIEQILHSVTLEAGRLREQMVKECQMFQHQDGLKHVGN